jgi:hypothetical protein
MRSCPWQSQSSTRAKTMILYLIFVRCPVRNVFIMPCAYESFATFPPRMKITWYHSELAT